MDLKTADFDYELPPELIAQHPLPERDASRMMVVSRETGVIEHKRFLDLPDCLSPGDLLVLNDTRVIPARLFGQRKGTGGKVELLLVERVGEGKEWIALCRAGWKPKEGIRLLLAEGRIEGLVTGVGEEGEITVELSVDGFLTDVLEKCGCVPLPPYIKREGQRVEGRGGEDRERYQTIYADAAGAVAAPTAGLHFTEETFRRLAARGVNRTALTLHVGPGTFRPVKTESVAEHRMGEERYLVGEETAREINAAREQGSRVVAVGSTSVRTLETIVSNVGTAKPGSGRSSLFIYPPFEFKVVDAMLTNFHLPRSTLIMMVSAFGGAELIRHAYEEAVKEKYRFYSYGDCMLIV